MIEYFDTKILKFNSLYIQCKNYCCNSPRSRLLKLFFEIVLRRCMIVIVASIKCRPIFLHRDCGNIFPSLDHLMLRKDFSLRSFVLGIYVGWTRGNLDF